MATSSFLQERALRDAFRQLTMADNAMEKAAAVLLLTDFATQGVPNNQVLVAHAPSEITQTVGAADAAGDPGATALRHTAAAYFVALGKKHDMTVGMSSLIDMALASPLAATTAVALDAAALLGKPGYHHIDDMHEAFKSCAARFGADETVQAALTRFESAAGKAPRPDAVEKILAQLFHADTAGDQLAVLRDVAAQAAEGKLSPAFNSAATARRGFDLVQQAGFLAAVQKDDGDAQAMEIIGAVTDLFKTFGQKKDTLPLAFEGLCIIANQTERVETALVAVRLATDLFRAHPEFEAMNMVHAGFQNTLRGGDIAKAGHAPEALKPVQEALWDLYTVFGENQQKRQLSRAATEPAMPASQPKIKT